MIRISSKNTFIDIVVSDDDEDEDALPPRSKSAEDASSKQSGDSLGDLARQSLQRLNAVLSIGMATGAKTAQQVAAIEPETPKDQQDSSSDGVSSDESVSELKNLKERLGNALVEKGQQRNTVDDLVSLQERLGKVLLEGDSHTAYNVELEPVTPDRNTTRTRMRHIYSSGSVSTMASEWSDGSSGESARNAQEMQGGYDFDSVSKMQTWSEKDEHGKIVAPTTVMIRGIPRRYSQHDLMHDLNATGFSGLFDFLYMPIDPNTLANLGYALVNFVNPACVAQCMRSFQNYPFKRHQRRRPCKVASVSVAPVQGLQMNLQHYDNDVSNVPNSHKQRPLVMANISTMLEQHLSPIAGA